MLRHMHRHWLKTLFGMGALLALFSLAVMLIWNAILPSLMAVGSLTYLQAAGLLLLCRILFGGLGMGLRGHHMHEHLRNMTPEQREAMMRRLRERFPDRGGFGSHPWGDSPSGSEKNGETQENQTSEK